MSENIKLGQIINGIVERDAVHVAIAPVIAVCDIEPGTHIGFTQDDTKHVGPSDNNIGIADPFLTKTIKKFEKFYMVLYPNTVSSLRHEWEHPAFINKNALIRDAAIEWMQNFADYAGLSYDDVMDAAERFQRSGDYYVQYGSESAEDAMHHFGVASFWHNYQIITGNNVTDWDGTVFSCSC